MQGYAVSNELQPWVQQEFTSSGPMDMGSLGNIYVPNDPPSDTAPQSSTNYVPMMNGGMNGIHDNIGHYSVSPVFASGPEGDPFPPPQQSYAGDMTAQEVNGEFTPSAAPGKSQKKRRKAGNCWVCTGDESRNQLGHAEPMLSCADCGRSAHLSCLNISHILHRIQPAEWKCPECKTCEVCGDNSETDFVMCDGCDRGWHTYCMNPRLDALPEGDWYCRSCSTEEEEPKEPLAQNTLAQEALEPEIFIDPALQAEDEANMQVDYENDSAYPYREQSVASSSVSLPIRQARSRSQSSPAKDRKGKARQVVLSDEDEEDNAEVGYMSTGIASPSKGKSSSRRKSKAHLEAYEAMLTSTTQKKRIKVVNSGERSKTRPSISQQTRAASPVKRLSVKLRIPSRGIGKATDEEDEPRKGLFDDVLSAEDRETSRSSILAGDKDRFEKARMLSEAKIVRQPTPEVDLSTFSGPSSGRFPLRSTLHQLQQAASQANHSRADSPTHSTPGPPQMYKFEPGVLRIKTIRFGRFEIDTWYDAPFPEEFSNIPEGRLWICEFCLKYMKSRFGSLRHRLKCKCQHPPGDEIYRDGNISIFEVDGRRNKIFCQHLCLLSKMFLDHKSLFYDVEPFLFYVITEVDDVGARFVGYFSKEKRSSKDLNLSCIMTLPVRQRQGWGNLLIDFSYLLSKKEGRVGTPERPLSALGAIGYSKYWTLAVMRYLSSAVSQPTLESISAATAMTLEDVYNTLVQLELITVHEAAPETPTRVTPGRSVRSNRSRKNGIARRALQRQQTNEGNKDADSIPFVPPESYEIRWDREAAKDYLSDWYSKGYLVLKPEKLKWTPFLLSRADMRVPPLGDVLTQPMESAPLPEKESAQAIEAEPATSAAADEDSSMVDLTDGPIPRGSPEPEEVTDALTTSDTTREESAGANKEQTSMRIDEIEVERVASSRPSPPSFLSSTHASGLEALAAVASAARNAMSTTGSRPSSSARSVASEKKRSERTGHDRRSTRSKTPQVLDDNLASTQSVLDKDAQLAAKLAQEESRPRRSLRSSSSRVGTPAAIDTSRLASASAAGSHDSPSPIVQPQRKRRKSVASTRETDTSASVPPTPVTPDRPTTRHQARVKTIETVTAGRVTRGLSSKLAAGGIDINLSIDTDIRSDGMRSPTIGRRNSRHNTASPTKSTTGSNSGGGGRRSRKRTDEVKEVDEKSVLKKLMEEPEDVDMDADGEGDSDEGTVDADRDAPETADMNDSYVHVNGVNGYVQKRRDKTNGNNVQSKTESVRATSAMSEAPNGMAVDDGDGELDAEGEPDEDAEGEPDPDLL